MKHDAISFTPRTVPVPVSLTRHSALWEVSRSDSPPSAEFSPSPILRCFPFRVVHARGAVRDCDGRPPCTPPRLPAPSPPISAHHGHGLPACIDAATRSAAHGALDSTAASSSHTSFTHHLTSHASARGNPHHHASARRSLCHLLRCQCYPCLALLPRTLPTLRRRSSHPLPAMPSSFSQSLPPCSSALLFLLSLALLAFPSSAQIPLPSSAHNLLPGLITPGLSFPGNCSAVLFSFDASALSASALSHRAATRWPMPSPPPCSPASTR